MSIISMSVGDCARIKMQRGEVCEIICVEEEPEDYTVYRMSCNVCSGLHVLKICSLDKVYPRSRYVPDIEPIVNLHFFKFDELYTLLSGFKSLELMSTMVERDPIVDYSRRVFVKGDGDIFEIVVPRESHDHAPLKYCYVRKVSDMEFSYYINYTRFVVSHFNKPVTAKKITYERLEEVFGEYVDENSFQGVDLGYCLIYDFTERDYDSIIRKNGILVTKELH